MEKDILLGYVGDVIIRINSWFKGKGLIRNISSSVAVEIPFLDILFFLFNFYHNKPYELYLSSTNPESGVPSPLLVLSPQHIIVIHVIYICI